MFKRSSNKFNIIAIIIAFLIVSDGLKYIYWKASFWHPFIKLIGLFLLCILPVVITKKKNLFSPLVLFFALYPVVAMFTSYYIYDQDIVQGINPWIPNLIWLAYFLIPKTGLKERDFIKAILLFSILIVSIQIVQQFTYPDAFWGVRSKDDMLRAGIATNVDIRNGLYRFRLPHSSYFSIIPLLYYLNLSIKKNIFKYYFIAGLMMVSIYLTLARQTMASCIIIVIILFFSQKRLRIQYVLLLLSFFALLFVSYEFLFAELSEQTSEELTDDYIRLLSYNFYIEKICSSPIAFILGSGVPGSTGPYHNLMDSWSYLHLFVIDIGFVGAWYTYGFIYVLAFFYMNYLILIKYRKRLPLYLVLTVLFTFCMSIMIFPFESAQDYLYWAFILYIVDLHLTEYKDKKYNGRICCNSKL